MTEATLNANNNADILNDSFEISHVEFIVDVW